MHLCTKKMSLLREETHIAVTDQPMVRIEPNNCQIDRKTYQQSYKTKIKSRGCTVVEIEEMRLRCNQSLHAILSERRPNSRSKSAPHTVLSMEMTTNRVTKYVLSEINREFVSPVSLLVGIEWFENIHISSPPGSAWKDPNTYRCVHSKC